LLCLNRNKSSFKKLIHEKMKIISQNYASLCVERRMINALFSLLSQHKQQQQQQQQNQNKNNDTFSVRVRICHCAEMSTKIIFFVFFWFLFVLLKKKNKKKSLSINSPCKCTMQFEINRCSYLLFAHQSTNQSFFFPNTRKKFRHRSVEHPHFLLLEVNCSKEETQLIHCSLFFFFFFSVNVHLICYDPTSF
jgi:hypothetical protein